MQFCKTQIDIGINSQARTLWFKKDGQGLFEDLIIRFKDHFFNDFFESLNTLNWCIILNCQSNSRMLINQFIPPLVKH